MTVIRVTHLVDDTTAGGVMRVVSHMMTTPDLKREADHSLLEVKRNRHSVGRLEADVIISHLAISWRLLPLLASLRVLNPAARLIHVEHSYTKCFTVLNVRRKRRFGALLKLSYALFHNVVAVSAAQGQWLRDEGFVRPDAMHVIPSCVDLSAFRELAPSEGAVKTIGAIGRLEPQKGFDILIKAFRELNDPGIALHIYGQGSEERLLRDLAAGDPRIHFKGFSSNPVATMASLDAVMMPSRWEAYGLVAIETLAARRRLLVSNVDGLTDHLPHGAALVDGAGIKPWQSELEELFAAPPRPRGLGHAHNYERHFSDCWKSLCLSPGIASQRGSSPAGCVF
ncbi:glycosyltransferase [Leisingera sp. SS27]|uniref:glycosyltransferase n=1 Tax=Leisingera sp. SS27 TaxID=2979462 RepID=UPI00232EE704|nr:glycosyltransferase [Leisingera sp. SS27]MDC0657810.1 glycosyltransferase [Leisingera sp. SS27]